MPVFARYPMAVSTVFSARPPYHRGMDVIYVDELFFLNGLIDYLLLLLSARLLGAPLRRGRFALSAGLGGAYAVAAAIPALGWLRTAGGKLAVSLALAWAAFGAGRALWRGWLAFLALAAGFAGAVFAAALLAGQEMAGGFLTVINWRILFLSFGVCYAAVRFFLSRLPRDRERQIFPAEVTLLGRTVALSALRDTGNSLTDPISGCGVLIADAAVLAPLFPGSLPSPAPEDAAALFRLLAESEALRPRLRLIPYAALGKTDGLLLCFRPDAVAVGGVPRELMVAVSPTPLRGGEYNAIF